MEVYAFENLVEDTRSIIERYANLKVSSEAIIASILRRMDTCRNAFEHRTLYENAEEVMHKHGLC